MALTSIPEAYKRELKNAVDRMSYINRIEDIRCMYPSGEEIL